MSMYHPSIVVCECSVCVPTSSIYIHFLCTYVSFYLNGSVSWWVGSQLTQEQMSEHKRRPMEGVWGIYIRQVKDVAYWDCLHLFWCCLLSCICIYINKCWGIRAVKLLTNKWQHLDTLRHYQFINTCCEPVLASLSKYFRGIGVGKMVSRTYLSLLSDPNQAITLPTLA